MANNSIFSLFKSVKISRVIWAVKYNFFFVCSLFLVYLIDSFTVIISVLSDFPLPKYTQTKHFFSTLHRRSKIKSHIAQNHHNLKKFIHETNLFSVNDNYMIWILQKRDERKSSILSLRKINCFTQLYIYASFIDKIDNFFLFFFVKQVSSPLKSLKSLKNNFFNTSSLYSKEFRDPRCLPTSNIKQTKMNKSFIDVLLKLWFLFTDYNYDFIYDRAYYS